MGCGVTKSDQFHKQSRKGNQTDALVYLSSSSSPISLIMALLLSSMFFFALHYNCNLPVMGVLV